MIPVIGSILGSVAGGIIGNITSAGDRERAQAAMAAALHEIQNLNVPADLAAPIILGKFQQAGILTPELEKSIKQETSKVAELKSDPALLQTQMSSLGALQRMAQGGLRPEDRLALLQARNQAEQARQGAAGQIQQQMQARGLAGSGAELAQQLANAQGAAQQEEMGGMNVAAQANQAALQGILQGGNLAGQISAQQFGQQQVAASAKDELDRFNIQNQLAQQQRNVQAQNQAQAANLANQQNVSNMNVQSQNQELAAQRQREAQLYGLQAQKAQMMAQAYGGQAQQAQQQAAQKQQGWSQIGSGVGSALGGYFSGAFDDPSKNPFSSKGERQYDTQTGNPILTKSEQDAVNRGEAWRKQTS